MLGYRNILNVLFYDDSFQIEDNTGDMESEEEPLHHGTAQQVEPRADGGDHSDSVMHTCNVCDKQFKTKSALTRHVKIHVEGKFVCDKCGKKFKSSWNRNYHEKQVHSEVRFPCDTCGKSYKMVSSLRAHKRKKHGDNSVEEMSTPQEDLEATKEAEDLEVTLEAEDSAAPSPPVVEVTIVPQVNEDTEVSPDSIVTEVAVDVITNNNHGTDEYILSGAVPPAAEEDDRQLVEGEEEIVMDEMPETMEVTQQASTPSHSLTSDKEEFNTVYNRCFQRGLNNNNNSFTTTTTVKIGERIITISGDSEELVGTAGGVLDNYFNVTPLSEEDSGEAALLHSTIGQDMPGPEVGSEDGDGDMEAATETAQEAVNSGAEAGDTAMETETEQEVVNAGGEAGDNGAVQAEGSSEKRYKCSLCDKSFSNKSYFRLHHKAHLFGKPFKCSECQKEFSHKHHLKKHQKYQHPSGDEKIQCPECGKEFRTHNNLKLHMVLHQQQEPYTGKFKTYSKEQKQKALLLVEKIGKAETARKMNITYSAINNWVSAAKKGYCCSECGKALSDSAELKKHERRKHGKQ